MHVDHLMFAAGPAGLDEDAARLGEILGASFINGGVHPSFGTRNRILPLVGPRYIEVVEVLARWFQPLHDKGGLADEHGVPVPHVHRFDPHPRVTRN